MSKIINIIKNNNTPQSSLIPEDAKYLEMRLNAAHLVCLDGGSKVSFAANVEEKPWGVSYGVLIKGASGNVVGRLESPMAIELTTGVYALADGTKNGFRVVAHDPTLRREICA